jgi:hypothetical protein
LKKKYENKVENIKQEENKKYNEKQLTTTTETGKTNKEVKIEFKWKINIY